MGCRFKILLLTCGLVFFAACGGGNEKGESAEESGISVESPGPSVSLDLEVDEDDKPDTTDFGPLFDGFTGDDSLTSLSENDETDTSSGESMPETMVPAATEAKKKLTFEAPQNCLDTSTAGTTEEFVGALHRNCLYRPFDGENQYWIKQIDVEGKDREWVRDVGFYRSPESRCLLGEIDHQDKCADDENEIFDTITKYEIVCTSDMNPPNDRIARRLIAVCSNAVIEE